MKIILLSRGGFNNPKSWSGTPYTLYSKLKEKRIDISTYDWQINRNILRIYHVIYGKIFFVLGSARDPLVHFLFKRKVTSILGKESKQKNWALFIPDICIPKSIAKNCRFSAYIDSFIPYMHQYVFKNDKRLRKNHVLSYFKKFDRLYTKQMSLIFTQNEWTRKSIIEEYDYDPSRIINIGFGINLKPFTDEKNYNENLLLIVLRKGTERYKGLLLLLEAFKILRQRLPEVKLAVVGTDVGMDQPGVTCYYKQSREVTVKLFQKATLYVMPALHEPNGITYLEGLANKAPIVGLNRFAVPEFSGYGEWGFIAQHENPQELANVIEEALSDKDRLIEMGNKGQNFVMKRYNWNIVINKMIQAYKNYDSRP